jgi:hypothetical protein
MFLLTGCASIDGRADAPARSKLVIGIARITVPARQGNVTAIDVSALGVGWDAGPWLGWRDDSRIEADPAQCHLLVVIRAAVEAANAASVLNKLKGEKICVADYTGGSLGSPSRRSR